MDLGSGMSSNAVIVVENRGNRLIVRISGAMRDNLVDLIEALHDLPEIPIEFDLEKVDSINSIAISDWVMFIKRFASKRAVSLIRCSPVIVNTMNLVVSFAAKCQVQSVMRSYVCDHDHQSFIEIKIDPNNVHLSDETKCPNCRRPARAEVNSEDYFQFAISA